MKIYTAYFHPNGFFVSADSDQDFWALLSKSLGWGKFVRIGDCEKFSTGCGGLFELREIRGATEKPPSPIISGSNVLWHLQEASAVLKRHAPSFL